MRDFLTTAGVTHLENAGAARGKGPVQQQREAKRKKASRPTALRKARGRKCFRTNNKGT
ncbi:uncharacterized LOC128071544 homolog [Anolis carolinensis]|uniref:uncharacterized LOC128071544 homolog n=1 Tax=Anolis carolinensis TaxID=28377 RepID=UPI002F2B4CAE